MAAGNLGCRTLFPRIRSANRNSPSAFLVFWLLFRSAFTTVAAETPTATGSLPDLSLEQLINIKVESVTGASRYEQKVTEAPSSVSIITADEIKKFGYRTMSDVLRGVRGLYVSDDRNYQYLGVRGFLRPGDYNSRVLTLVDAHRMNDNIYGSAYYLIDVELIDRVEIIRGPGSSVYGSGAFFAVINIVTRRGRQIDGAEASVEAGGFDTYKGQFRFGKRFKNELDWFFAGSFLTSEGRGKLYYPEFDQRISSNPRATNDGIAENSDGQKFFSLFSSMNFHDLTLAAFLQGYFKNVPTASYETIFNDGHEKTADIRSYVDLKYDHSFSDDTRMLARVYFDVYPYYGTYPYTGATLGLPQRRVLFYDKACGEWGGAEWQLSQRLFDRHTLVTGIDYQENFRQHLDQYVDVSPRAYFINTTRTSRILGLYAQADWMICTNLVLNTGLRYDHYFQDFGGTVNPRLGLIYNPWKGATWKALYGEAFRAPNIYEQLAFPAQINFPKLQPEKIRTYEIVYEQYFARNYRASLSGYYYSVNDLISQTMDAGGNLAFANLDRVAGRGAECELEAKYDNGLLARVSYAQQRAENSLTGVELSNSPRHLAKFNLIYPLYRDKIFSGLELQYQGAVKTVRHRTADDFVLVNWTLFSRELVKDLEISASVYNLFDTRYGIPGSAAHAQDVIQQDGRSFRVKLTYKF